VTQDRGVGASGSRTARTSGRWIGYLAALVVSGLLVYAVVVASGGISSAAHQLRHASQGWLLPALLLEASMYALTGLMLRTLRGDNNTLGWGTTTRVGLVVWGLGSLLPASPAEGIAMAVAELRRRGVSRQDALTMLFVGWWFQFWALVLTAAASAALVGARAHVDPDDATHLVIAAAVLTVVAMTVVTVARKPITGRIAAEAIWRLPHRHKLTRDELRASGAEAHTRLVSLIGRPARRFGIGAAAAGAWMTDAACLWTALQAAHAHVDFSLVILAYVAGTVASWVPLLPGGLGAVEIAIPAVLHHFGVPLTVALAGTLLWRGLSLFLPAIAGALAYASLRAGHPHARTPAP
jgi:P-type Mg2+ transporter